MSRKKVEWCTWTYFRMDAGTKGGEGWWLSECSKSESRAQPADGSRCAGCGRAIRAKPAEVVAEVPAIPSARRAGKWTPEEDERLIQLRRAGVTFEEIARVLGRGGLKSVTDRLYSLRAQRPDLADIVNEARGAKKRKKEGGQG